MLTMEKAFSLGSKLRILRKERKLTQRELACRAGVSVNAISLIERDEISPSVATLQSLAAACNVKASYFFDDNVQTNVIHLKADKRPSISISGVRLEGIGKRLQGQQFECFLITLDAHSNCGEPVVHSGHEFIYCLRGTAEYTVDHNKYLLETGDILLFEATLPHGWRNPTEEKVGLLLILQSSDEPSEPVRGHFPSYPSLTHIE